ncbi:hypothetical protein [Thiothrix eikelboomii]|uniref:hypothetical protein n=1 Tax=Thiothrix eikelboomii TaxID=92487 RepID=UPI003BB17DA3
MHLNQSIFTLSLLTILCSTSSLLSAKEYKPATIKPTYAPETMYRGNGSTFKLEKTKLSDEQIIKFQIGTFPLFIDLGKKYFAGFRGPNERPKQTCANASFTLQSIPLNTYLQKLKIGTKQWKFSFPYDDAMSRSVTLVKTNCKIPFFREFIFDSPKEVIESGGEYGSIFIQQAGVLFQGNKPVPIILPSH